MTVLDWIRLVVICVAVVLCAINGKRKTVFRICAFAIVIIMAKLVGARLGKILLSDIVKIKENSLGFTLSEKFYSTLISTLGTLIVFLILFFILKKIFSIVEGKMERKLHSVIIDRLCGTLDGLFFDVAAVVVNKIVVVIFTVISVVRCDREHPEYVDNTSIFKLSRNLN